MRPLPFIRSASIAVLLISGPAAADIDIDDNGKVVDKTCAAGERVEISGNSHVITLRGDCGALRVRGNEHRVQVTGSCTTARVSGTKNRVDLARVASIRVSGLDNVVSWASAASGKRPKIRSGGTGNVVRRKTE